MVKHWPVNDDAAFVQRARRVFGETKLIRYRPPREIRIEEVKGSVRGEWLTPTPLRLTDAVLLYIHGGGFVSCSPRTHRPATASLARMIGCRVFSLDYRLAPEHPFPAAVEDSLATFQWLMAQGIKPKNIALAGDSAGGGLVMATLVGLRERGIELPSCAACIAPAVDLTGELTFTNSNSCAMFLPEDGRTFASIYLNGVSPHSPLASPLFADMKGMPPLLIQVADRELLYDDAVRLHEKVTASGVESRLHVYPGLPHVWHMFVGVVPEAGEALREIADFVKEKVGVLTAAPSRSA